MAKDIAQEVIIRFWEHPERDKITSVSDFLFIMTRNASLNYLRGRKREEKRYLNILSELEKEQEFFNILVEEEHNQLLISAINKLPKENARIIRYALSGFNNKEIANLLGISVNTVKSIKYSEMRRLKQYFESIF